MIDKEIIADSIEYYGKKTQSIVCMEECAELIQAISKELRGKSDRMHLAEEMAERQALSFQFFGSRSKNLMTSFIRLF